MKNLLLFGGIVLSLNALSQTSITENNFEVASPGGKSGLTEPISDTLVFNTYTSMATADVQSLPDGEKLYLYPNPAVESFEVVHSFNQPIERLTIRDNNGRKVRTYDKPKPEKFFIADIGSGIYSVEVTFGANTYGAKLVIP